MPRRLFFALLPPRALADEMVLRAARLGLGGRLVAADRLHLTLACLGPRDTSAVEALLRGVDNISAAPFTMSIDRLGGFQGARTAWFGPERAPVRLTALAAELGKQGVDRQRFVPHITVIRDCVPPAPTALFPPMIWHVAHLALIESGHDGMPGAYHTLARWRLSDMVRQD